MFKQRSIERREYVRANAHGSVLLRCARREIHGRLMAVSGGSVEVKCQLGCLLPAMADVSVDLELWLHRSAGGWFWLHGQVTHVRAASHSLVIAIDAMPRELAAAGTSHFPDIRGPFEAP